MGDEEEEEEEKKRRRKVPERKENLPRSVIEQAEKAFREKSSLVGRSLVVTGSGFTGSGATGNNAASGKSSAPTASSSSAVRGGAKEDRRNVQVSSSHDKDRREIKTS